MPRECADRILSVYGQSVALCGQRLGVAVCEGSGALLGGGWGQDVHRDAPACSSLCSGGLVEDLFDQHPGGR